MFLWCPLMFCWPCHWHYQFTTCNFPISTRHPKKASNIRLLCLSNVSFDTLNCVISFASHWHPPVRCLTSDAGAAGSWIIVIVRIIGQIIDCRHDGADYIYRLRGVHLRCTKHSSRSGPSENDTSKTTKKTGEPKAFHWYVLLTWGRLWWNRSLINFHRIQNPAGGFGSLIDIVRIINRKHLLGYGCFCCLQQQQQQQQ